MARPVTLLRLIEYTAGVHRPVTRDQAIELCGDLAHELDVVRDLTPGVPVLARELVRSCHRFIVVEGNDPGIVAAQDRALLIARNLAHAFVTFLDSREPARQPEEPGREETIGEPADRANLGVVRELGVDFVGDLDLATAARLARAACALTSTEPGVSNTDLRLWRAVAVLIYGCVAFGLTPVTRLTVVPPALTEPAAHATTNPDRDVRWSFPPPGLVDG